MRRRSEVERDVAFGGIRDCDVAVCSVDRAGGVLVPDLEADVGRRSDVVVDLARGAVADASEAEEAGVVDVGAVGVLARSVCVVRFTEKLWPRPAVMWTWPWVFSRTIVSMLW